MRPAFVVLALYIGSVQGVDWETDNWAFACDFKGGDIGNVQVRGEDCGGKCATTSGCTHFTWTSYNGGTCWMKGGAVSNEDAFDTGDESMVCGIVSSGGGGGGGDGGGGGGDGGGGGGGGGSGSINWDGNNWALACDFTDGDIGNAQISGADCGGKCATTSGCTHFTWTTYNGGTCWMKGGSVSQSDAIYTGDESMVCGVVSSTNPPSTDRCKDYGTLIELSTQFYEAQRSGKLPANRRVTWRKDSALNDKGNNGEDLTGGYYDAGDYVKFGFPFASAMTVLAWGGVAYGDAYSATGQTKNLLDAVKWGTDYILKAHVSANVLYGQVGDGDLDHAWWGRPEDMTMARPAYSITTSKPGSDLAGETAAALAAASILFKTSNSGYSASLLTHARQLFTFADKYRGLYSSSIQNAAKFYRSSGFQDELAWAAVWLYKATGEANYLNFAKGVYSQNGFTNNRDPLTWDSKVSGVKVLLAQITGDATYVNDVNTLCSYFINNIPKSPKGLIFFSEWGSLKQAAGAAYICLVASDLNIAANLKTNYINFANDQMEYFLQKTGRSFVVGFGNNYPTHAHHKSSSCPLAPASCGWDQLHTSNPNPNVLNGALVGGPRAANDQYTDSREDYVGNEVALDYNAAFQSLIAGLRKKKC